ncbi:MAG: OmpA family protein [Deltaproteobacteria bacterium]
MKRKSMTNYATWPLAALFAACASTAPAPEANDANEATAEPAEAVGPYALHEGRPADAAADPVIPDVALDGVPASEGQVVPVAGDAQVEAPTVHRVLFAESQWTVGPVGDATIATAANHIRANPLAKVVVVGHADDAVAEREDIVARRRADAVVEGLVAEGVSGARIQVVEAAEDSTGRHDVQIRVFAPSRVDEEDVVAVEAK